MNRERQTLELLTLLGDDVANAVLERLQPERAQTLRSRMSDELLQKSTISRQREVLDEFECFFQFALKSKQAEEAVREQYQAAEQESTSETTATQTEGQPSTETPASTSASEPPATVSKAELESTQEASAAEATSNDAGTANGAGTVNVQESPSSDTSNEPTEEKTEEQAMASTSPDSTKSRVLTETDDPLVALASLSIHQIAAALESEQARTSAILLSNIPARLTGEVLNLLKPDYQKLVMKELTKEQHAPPVLVERIARATFARASQMPSEPPDSRDHADKVAEMLRSVPKAGRRNMLAAIEEQNPELAKSLLTRIYRFDDITSLGKTVVQRVLGEVDSTNLTTALCGAPEDVKDAIFVNLSKRARQTIEEEMQFMTNVAESRIRQARDSIAEIIAKIDMEGEPE